MKSLVSVILPTKNSEDTIRTCLKSVREQNYPNIGVIVIDACSSDSTREIAENFGAKIIVSKTGRSIARNIGARKAAGEWILFLDSDMELDSSVIEECVKEIGKGSDAVIIPEISVGEGFWAKCKALEKRCYIGDDLIEAARFFRRSVFENMGGYDAELEAGEDWDLNQRLSKAGYRIGRINAFIKHYEGRLSLRAAMLKKRYYGKTLERYRKKHPTEARHQLKLIRPAFTRNWRGLVKDPVHALGMLVMKACELGAAGLGFLATAGDNELEKKY